MQKKLVSGWLLLAVLFLIEQVTTSGPMIVELVQRNSPRSSARSKRQTQSLKFDFDLHAKISVGSNKQPFDVIIELGWFETWVCWVNCNKCKFAKNKYTSQKSNTYNNMEGKFNESIDDSELIGTYASDDWTIGGMTIKNQVFGVVKSISGNYDNEGYDGRIGLSPKTFYWSEFLGVIDNLYMQGKTSVRMFSIWLSKKDTSGELAFGNLNPNRFTGSIVFVAGIGDGTKWRFKMEKMNVTVSSKTTTACSGGCEAYLTTLSSSIYGPKAEVDAIHQALNAKNDSDGDYYFQCSKISSLPDLVFTISSRAFPVKRSEYIEVDSKNKTICWSRLIAHSKNEWKLGAPFLKSVYTVYDQNFAIGFSKSIP